MGWWYGRADRIALPPPADSYPLQLIVVPGKEIQRHLPETLHVEATGLGGRISCILSPRTFPSDLTKKDSRSTDLR